MMKKRCSVAVLLSVFLIVGFVTQVQADDMQAYNILKKALDYVRGESSIVTSKMTIHRPDWQRSMSIKAWTKGSENAIFYIIEPKEEFGTGTLKTAHGMWSYNPKINRTTRIPPSMMSQGWQGSDISYNELSKNDDELKLYTHKIISTDKNDGKKVHVIECIPKKGAPVVWGMIKIQIREDNIILKSEFFDEEFQLVKTADASQIQMMGGKLLPKITKVTEASNLEKYTLLENQTVEYNAAVSDRLFTIYNLQNPRR
jgi:outer membrane lipoprotein-sorting protein